LQCANKIEPYSSFHEDLFTTSSAGQKLPRYFAMFKTVRVISRLLLIYLFNPLFLAELLTMFCETPWCCKILH